MLAGNIVSKVKSFPEKLQESNLQHCSTKFSGCDRQTLMLSCLGGGAPLMVESCSWAFMLFFSGAEVCFPCGIFSCFLLPCKYFLTYTGNSQTCSFVSCMCPLIIVIQNAMFCIMVVLLGFGVEVIEWHYLMCAEVVGDYFTFLLGLFAISWECLIDAFVHIKELLNALW